MSAVELQKYTKSEEAQSPGLENKGFIGNEDDHREPENATHWSDSSADPEQVVITDGARDYQVKNNSKGIRVEDEDDEDDDEEEDEGGYNYCSAVVLKMQNVIYSFWRENKKILIRIFLVVLLALYLAYVIYSLRKNFGDEGSWRLLICTVIGGVLLAVNLLAVAFREPLNNAFERFAKFRERKGTQRIASVIRWSLYVAMLAFMVVYLIVNVFIDDPNKLIYIGGLAVYILLIFVTSTNPAKVNWHPVFWGIALQFVFALIILRTYWGKETFFWLGDRVTEFLNYTKAGSQFLFNGASIKLADDFIFAFGVLPIIIFVGSMTSIMYYLGVIQILVKYIGMFLAFCLGTSAAESLSAAANIFLGMTESPLIIKNYIGDMTRSEIHAIMTGGFATIAGSVLGAYINMGVPAHHLLSASVMSAPAALALSKLSCPQTNPKKVAKNQDFTRMAKSTDRNLVASAANGAMFTIKLVANIAVNLIAFLAILAFLNATLTWFGDRASVDNLTFELISSYVLYPVAFLMGVDSRDCRKMAELIGVKTFTNEFLAYSRLGEILKNNVIFNEYIRLYPSPNDWSWDGTHIYLNQTQQTLLNGVLFEEKSVMIATYALCGFANFGSIGITLGGLEAIAPRKKSILSRLVVRAMIVGNVACFMTACFAGLLHVD